jgi:hypothetical protein
VLRRSTFLGAFALLGCTSSSVPLPDGGGLDHDASTRDSAAESAAPVDATQPEASSVVDATLDAPDDVALVDAGAPDADGGGCAVGPFGEPTELSCAGLYSDWASKTVAPELHPFAPGVVLWSDSALKSRWVYLPPGTTINTSNMDEWVFPVGTKFFKEFRIPAGDSSTPIRIETRLLWKQGPGSWYRTTYRWSDDGETSAHELTTGQLNANGNGYEVPTQLECNSCHQGRLDGILGFEALALSLPSATGLTIGALADGGLLTNLPDAALSIPGDAVESAALGWMHMNCGAICHNRGNGLAAGTGFFMRLETAKLGSVAATDTYTTGWNKPATGFNIPDASATYLLHACDLAESAAYYRDSHRDDMMGTPPSTQMPPIDSHIVDDAGVASVAAWIMDNLP